MAKAIDQSGVTSSPHPSRCGTELTGRFRGWEWLHEETRSCATPEFTLLDSTASIFLFGIDSVAPILSTI